ncbi:MAG TPA: DUF4231 domain-containing protein [Bacteroidia bacterium]|nr:DUF4231 domain-containing protein [Bacteroidia bacterium]
MEKMSFDDYVVKRYNDQMNYYDKAASKYQKRYKLFQWILIILSAITPVLAALNGMSWSHDDKSNTVGTQFVQMIVVVVSSVVAILTSGLKTFQYQDLWVTYRTTNEQLKPEFYYYEFSIGPYGAPGVDKESIFVSRVEAILNKEHVQWPPAKNLQDEQNKQKSSENDHSEDPKNPEK